MRSNNRRLEPECRRPNLSHAPARTAIGLWFVSSMPSSVSLSSMTGGGSCCGSSMSGSTAASGSTGTTSCASSPIGSSSNTTSPTPPSSSLAGADDSARNSLSPTKSFEHSMPRVLNSSSCECMKTISSASPPPGRGSSCSSSSNQATQTFTTSHGTPFNLLIRMPCWSQSWTRTCPARKVARGCDLPAELKTFNLLRQSCTKNCTHVLDDRRR